MWHRDSTVQDPEAWGDATGSHELVAQIHRDMATHGAAMAAAAAAQDGVSVDDGDVVERFLPAQAFEAVAGEADAASTQPMVVRTLLTPLLCASGSFAALRSQLLVFEHAGLLVSCTLKNSFEAAWVPSLMKSFGRQR